CRRRPGAPGARSRPGRSPSAGCPLPSVDPSELLGTEQGEPQVDERQRHDHDQEPNAHRLAGLLRRLRVRAQLGVAAERAEPDTECSALAGASLRSTTPISKSRSANRSTPSPNDSTNATTSIAQTLLARPASATNERLRVRD